MSPDAEVVLSSSRGFVVSEDMFVKPIELTEEGGLNTENFLESSAELYACALVNSSQVAVGGDNGIQIRNLENFEEGFKQICNEMGSVNDLSFNKGILSAACDKGVFVYSFAKGTVVEEACLKGKRYISCCLSPNAGFYASTSEDGFLTLFDLTRNVIMGEWPIAEIDTTKDWIHTANAVFENEETLLVTGGKTLGVIKVSEASEGIRQVEGCQHNSLIYYACSLGEGRLLTVGAEGEARVWELSTGKQLCTIKVPRIQRGLMLEKQNILIFSDLQGNLIVHKDPFAEVKPVPQTAPISEAQAMLPTVEPVPVVEPKVTEPKPTQAKEKSPKKEVKSKEKTPKAVQKEPAEATKPIEAPKPAETEEPAEAQKKTESPKQEEIHAEENTDMFHEEEYEFREEDVIPEEPEDPDQQEFDDQLAELTQMLDKNAKASKVPNSEEEPIAKRPAKIHYEEEEEKMDEEEIPVVATGDSEPILEEQQETAIQTAAEVVRVVDDQMDEEEMVMATKKGRKILEQFLETNPQQPTQFGSTKHQGKRNYMAWNMFGHLIMRENVSSTLIDVEYTLSDLPKRLINNNLNYTMGCINYSGVLLASPGVVRSEDEYDNEEMEEDHKTSILYFKAAQSLVEWTVRLPQDENISCICLGDNWSAAATNRQLIRLFTPQGLDYFAFGFPNEVVSLASYENLLAILYHDSFPFSGHQCLKVKLFNVYTFQTVLETTLTITPKAKVKWFGFSQEGALYAQDTAFVLWAMANQGLWTPVYDGSANKNCWIIGVSEASIVSILLPYDELEPNPAVFFPQKSIAMKVPLLNPGTNAELALKTVRNEQEELRTGIWGHVIPQKAPFNEAAEEQDEKINFFRDTIKSVEELEAMKVETDKMRIELVRQAVLANNDDDAVFYGLQLETARYLETCVKVIEKLNKPELAKRLQKESKFLGRVQYRSAPHTKFVPQVVYERIEVSDCNKGQIKPGGWRGAFEGEQAEHRERDANEQGGAVGEGGGRQVGRRG